MKRLLFLFVIVLIASGNVLAQNQIPPPLITVSGQAEIRVPPDEVVFTLGIEAVDKDVLAAKQRTDDSVKEVLAIARKNNIKPEDVQTSQISVQPKYNTDDLDYEQRRTVKREFVGYQVSKTVAVILRDISRFDGMLFDVLKAGVTRLSNLQFRDSQNRKHKDQARAMAIKAAQEKANLLAREIGQTIGPAYSITETAVTPYDNVSQNVAGVAGRSSDDQSEGAIAPGSLSITAHVTVSFRLQ
ncbi:MAG: SIMPL domain-containing protein [Acidobacteriota bacterium]